MILVMERKSPEAKRKLFSLLLPLLKYINHMKKIKGPGNVSQNNRCKLERLVIYISAWRPWSCALRADIF